MEGFKPIFDNCEERVGHLMMNGMLPWENVENIKVDTKGLF